MCVRVGNCFGEKNPPVPVVGFLAAGPVLLGGFLVTAVEAKGGQADFGRRI